MVSGDSIRFVLFNVHHIPREIDLWINIDLVRSKTGEGHGKRKRDSRYIDSKKISYSDT